MSIILDKMKNKVANSPHVPTIVFPEGWNAEIQTAAKKIAKDGHLTPLLVFKKESDIPANPEYKTVAIDKADLDKMAKQYYELRKHKGMTEEKARKIVAEPNFFATMLIHNEEADGYVGGIEYTTADTMRPALQIIKTSPDWSIVSSAFIMEKGDERLVFSDCAININPTSEQLAQITKQTVRLAKRVLDCKNTNAALLSFSTVGSAAGPEVEKVQNAVKILKDEKYDEADVFGEMQFDAAYVKKVRDKKAPDCKWDDRAAIYVFPSLEAGNIGYKIAQRLGGYQAIGPIIMGLKKPVNDLSRGAVADDAVATAYTTAAQFIAIKDFLANKKA